MLQFNFTRVFKARGIDRPFTFLRGKGFSAYFASKIVNNRVQKIDLQMTEKLCVNLNCTPNDFFEWTPKAGDTIAEDHLLHRIRRTDKVIDITRVLNSVPFDKLAEIEAFIQEKI